MFHRFSKTVSWVSKGIWVGVGVETKTGLVVGLCVGFGSDKVGVINGEGIGVFVMVNFDVGFPELYLNSEVGTGS